MDTRPAFGFPAFGFKELFTFMIGDMGKAVCERKGETKQQQFTRSQVVVDMILGLRPRDVLEAMLAGHSVMFHEVIVDSVHDTLRGELDTMRRGTRSNLVAMNKAFTANLDRLERCQSRPSQGSREGSRDVPEVRPAETIAQTPIAEQTPRPADQAPPDATRAQAAPVNVPPANVPPANVPPANVPPAPAETREAPPMPEPDPLPLYLREEVIDFRPSPETIAACRANPEAMAALEAGDPERFARAMGVDMPREDFLAAAAEPGTPFDTRAPGPWPAGQRSA